jgi:DNA-binding CsgD family transcriptional regulator
MDDLRQKITALAPLWRLSPREFEVLLLIVDGAETDEAIARRLDIALRTAKTHVHNILIKTGCGTKVGLLARLLRDL